MHYQHTGKSLYERILRFFNGIHRTVTLQEEEKSSILVIIPRRKKRRKLTQVTKMLVGFKRGRKPCAEILSGMSKWFYKVKIMHRSTI